MTPVLAAVPSSPDQVVKARILPGWQTGSHTHMAALELTLAPQWHTYWRAPGDAGIPPSFDWRGSRNIASVRIHWPRPQIFRLQGLQSVGYLDHLVLPLEFTPKDPRQPIELKARVDIGVCNDICLPVTLSLTADLGQSHTPDPAIEQALARVPEPARRAGLHGFQCTLAPIADGLHLTARITLPKQGPEETALFETANPDIWVGKTSTRREGDMLIASADLVPPTPGPFAFDRSKMRITILGQDRAVALNGCPAG
ncbi:hypothetical protein FGG78_22790 [Thioclava sp. BHET1]|nr:hypothetical protein FGG78_22790 [Thioclava sp. BHET1]